MTFDNFKKINILGEYHGKYGNIDTLSFFLKELEKARPSKELIIGFEWPKSLTPEINKYIKGQSNLLNWESWDFTKCNDGRISSKHIAFLESLRKNREKSGRKYQILCFSELASDWNERDEKMANNIKNAVKKKDSIILAMIGNLHARKKSFRDGEYKHKPVASHFKKDEILSLKLVYNRKSTHTQSIIKIKKPLPFSKSYIFFDYEVLVEDAKP